MVEFVGFRILFVEADVFGDLCGSCAWLMDGGGPRDSRNDKRDLGSFEICGVVQEQC